MKYIVIYILLMLLPPGMTAQEDSVFKRKSFKRSSAVFELSKSLEQAVSNDTLAADYEKVAKEFIDTGDFMKAEDYFNRALKIYESGNNKSKRAYIEREIAKVRELQGNYSGAIESFTKAGNLSESGSMKELNLNDAERLKNRPDPRTQSSYIKRNIDLLNTIPSGHTDDKINAYSQMAEVSNQLNDAEAAVSNLQSALEVAEKPSQTLQVKREIANVYASENELEKVIDINKEILEEAVKTSNTKVRIEQLKALSSAYIENEEISKGIASLQQAYDLAIEEGNTLEAKNSLKLLVDLYSKENNYRKALDIYADFMSKLETLVKSDSTLIDEKIFEVHEQKIAGLEKERALKDELIRKKNLTNSILGGSIILALILFLFILKVLYSIKKKNKKIALQSLRREMNPHFIFNSLNSVNQFIAQNNELEANKYLSSYSKLMRNIMENSNKDFTPLSTELEQIREYLDLEHMRFKDKFTYAINLDEGIDMDATYIPNMLIQPQLENAVWHGLRYLSGHGLLQLTIKKEDNSMVIIIDDNGIGLKKSNELKTKHQKEHKSRGLTNTHERIKLLNSLYNCKITIDIIEKYNQGKGEQGVLVILRFPQMTK